MRTNDGGVDDTEGNQNLNSPALMTDEYQALLAEAKTEDFSDLERAEVIQTGMDISGNRVVIFIPRLGFQESRDSNSQLRRMLLLFIKKVHQIVTSPYIFVYDHMHFSVFSQQPLIYRTYSMLPREYKKNIKKLLVVHPTFIIRMFFEQGVKYFVSQKFYNKLKFVDSIIELQRLIFPLGGALPTGYLKRGDAKKHSSQLKKTYESSHMPSLEDSFNATLGTTDVIHQCVTFLCANNRLQTEGLFRLAGDQAVLDLVQARLFGRLDQPPTVVIGSEAYENLGLPSTHDGDGASTNSGASYSTLVVTAVHTVTSILGMSLRCLPVSLITPEVHQSLLVLTKQLEKDQNIEEWHRSVTPLLESMPECHTKTLNHLLRFLAQVTLESATNEMTVENISRVFAPSLFPETPIDAANPMLAFAEVQLQKEILTHLLTKYMRSEETVLSNVKLSAKMMSRIHRGDVYDEDDDDDDDDDDDGDNCDGDDDGDDETPAGQGICEGDEKEKVTDHTMTQTNMNDLSLSPKMMNRLTRPASEGQHDDENDDV